MARRLTPATIAATALLGALLWRFVLDGATPRDPGYAFPIAELRAAIAADPSPLPESVAYEIVSERTAPKLATHAGLDLSPVRLGMTAFRVAGPATNVVVESAIDKAIFDRTAGKSGVWHEDAYKRMNAALASADVVLVTHEHYDHIAGIARHPDPARLAPRLRLTAPQIAALPENTQGPPPDAYRTLRPADLSRPTLVAPGVAAAPAPGHTPGSQIVLVRRRDGREILFVGDIVWTMSNVERAWGRPRLLQRLFFTKPEDRATVQRQVRALHELATREPELAVAPTHDVAQLERLAREGVVSRGFPGDAAQ